MTAASGAQAPAQALTGMDLPGDWKVLGPVGKAVNATGGHFSANYEVRNADGRTAFLKAIDFSGALQSHDPAGALQSLTSIFVHERDLVRDCSSRNLSRIVTVIDDGSIMVPGAYPYPQVSYIIFELADGDIRKFKEFAGSLDLAWALRTMHHVALGLRQLHNARIAHQDLKPSNVMTFGDRLSKIGDLGRASQFGRDSPFDEMVCAGDTGYAAPELMYGFLLPGWNERRRAVDLYHLGSLLLFQLTGINATGALITELELAYSPAQWGGSYDDVLIYLRDATDRVAAGLPEFPDSRLSDDIRQRFRELCDPDPRLRGHPKNHVGANDPYSLDRYVSFFDGMAARSERLVTRAITR